MFNLKYSKVEKNMKDRRSRRKDVFAYTIVLFTFVAFVCILALLMFLVLMQGV